MTLETFFEKFDQFADAPNAVAKMRELVLDLAIQGMLVAQFGDEEPALKQLERIAAKKSRTGRVTRVKVRSNGSFAAGETDTHVPSGWEKTSLAELVTVLNGRAYSKDELLAAGTPVLRVGNLFTSKHWYYSDLQLEPDKYCDKGDLIFAWSASFGPFIWPGPKVIYHYHIWKLELHSETDLHKGFLYWFLQNKTQEIKRAGHGVSMLHMTKEKMEKLEVMVPPLAEQKRIVAKVDELMALCDRLESQQQEREQQASQLTRASLARFADAPTPANLEYLFHSSFIIPPSSLRKSILTLAVQGNLVPQDPNDEPAEVPALSRVTKSKGEREAPFELPANWKWVQLGQVSELINGDRSKNYPNKAEYVPEGVAWINTGHIEPDGTLSTEWMHFITRKKFDSLRSGKVRPGDLVYCLRGATLGKTAIITQYEEGAVASSLVIIRLIPAVESRYAYRFLTSPLGREQIFQFDNGSAQPNLSANNVKKYWIPLPPLAEQRRIVAKVEQLMALVDALETQLAASRATAANLLSALVAELTTQD